MPGSEAGSEQYFAGLTDLFDRVGNLSVSGFSNPSICYTLELANPTEQPQSLAFTFEIPTMQIDIPYQVNTILMMELVDGSGDNQVTVETPYRVQWRDGLDADRFVTAIGAVSGTDLAETTVGTGELVFNAGPVAGPQPTNQGSPIEWMRLVVHLTPSAGDSATIRDHANIDTGSDAVLCAIPSPALPWLCGNPTIGDHLFHLSRRHLQYL